MVIDYSQLEMTSGEWNIEKLMVKASFRSGLGHRVGAWRAVNNKTFESFVKTTKKGLMHEVAFRQKLAYYKGNEEQPTWEERAIKAEARVVELEKELKDLTSERNSYRNAVETNRYGG